MLKNNKGVSLTTMVITVILMLIILSTLVYSSVTSVQVRKLNKLYNDIRQLNDAVAVYYMKTGTLPIDSSSKYTIATTDTMANSELAAAVLVDGATKLEGKSSLINPNDYDTQLNNAVYYKVDSSKLENLSLNYNDTDDVFIINEISHAIYYLKGLSIDGVSYYALPISYRDMKYNEQYPVKSISLKSTGSTNIKIYMDAKTGSTLNILNFIQFNYNATDGNGQPKTVKFTVDSNATDVLEVDSSGNVKVKNVEKLSTKVYSDAAKGRVPITLSGDNYSTTNSTYSTTINIYLVGFSIKDTDGNDLTDTKMVTGSKKEITIEKNKINGTELLTGDWNFSSDNENIAKITKETVSGVTKYYIETGTEIGTATVTVISANGSVSRSVKVTNYKTIVKASSKEIENSKIEFKSIGSVIPLTVEVTGKELNSNNVKVEWSVEGTFVELRNEASATSGSQNLIASTDLYSNSFGTDKLTCKIRIEDVVIQEKTYDVSVDGVQIVKESASTEDTDTLKNGNELNLGLNYSNYDSENPTTIESVTWSVATASGTGKAEIAAKVNSKYVSVDESTGDVKIDVSADTTIDFSTILTAEEIGTVKVTATVVLKKGSITTEYTDTYTITIE